MFYIPYVKMTKDRQDECACIMSKGNLILEKYQKSAKVSMSRDKFLVALLAKLKDGPRDVNGNITKIPAAVRVHGVRINKGDITKILEVKNLEWDILCSIGDFLKKLVNKTYRNPYNTVEWDDLYNEAISAGVIAIHYYTKTKTKPITYISEAIRRNLFRVVQEDTPMAGISRQARELFSKFSEAKRSAEQKVGHPVGFDELVNKLGLSKRQRKTLENMLVRVIEEQAVSRNTAHMDVERGTSNDYTAMVKHENRPVLEIDQHEAIAKADLDPWELDVLVAFLESAPGTNGWQTEVANRHINPDTGKCFSRAAPALALKRIKRKIRENYGTVAA